MKDMFLIDSEILPEVFQGVINAKRLLSAGKARSSSEAARMAGISRSAFYKYRDKVFSYNEPTQGRIVTIHSMLDDRPGILSQYITRLYQFGANILTVNQDIPSGGYAPVSVSLRIDDGSVDVDRMIAQLRSLDGVQNVTQIMG